LSGYTDTHRTNCSTWTIKVIRNYTEVAHCTNQVQSVAIGECA